MQYTAVWFGAALRNVRFVWCVASSTERESKGAKGRSQVSVPLDTHSTLHWTLHRGLTGCFRGRQVAGIQRIWEDMYVRFGLVLRNVQ